MMYKRNTAKRVNLYLNCSDFNLINLLNRPEID